MTNELASVATSHILAAEVVRMGPPMRLKLTSPDDLAAGLDFANAVADWLCAQGFNVNNRDHSDPYCPLDHVMEYEVIGEGQVRFKLLAKDANGRLITHRGEGGEIVWDTYEEIRYVKTMPPLLPSNEREL